jgi:hypothetical protein
MAKTTKGGGKTIPKVQVNRSFSSQDGEKLILTLQDRFEENMDRHEGLEWSNIKAKLKADPDTLGSLFAMESTGGEPDVVGYDQDTEEYIFYDCSEQSPTGRRSICYDGDGESERIKKGVHPGGNALDLAAAMGIELLNEVQYRELQQLGEFDTKTESWLHTPAAIREKGGAIFGDRRYDHVFVFHNTAKSFYASRGFRGSVRV